MTVGNYKVITEYMRERYNRSPKPISFEDLRENWPQEWFKLLTDTLAHTFAERIPSMIEWLSRNGAYGKFGHRGGTIDRSATIDFPTLGEPVPVEFLGRGGPVDIPVQKEGRKGGSKINTVTVVPRADEKALDDKEKTRRAIIDELRRGQGPGANADKWK